MRAPSLPWILTLQPAPCITRTSDREQIQKAATMTALVSRHETWAGSVGLVSASALPVRMGAALRLQAEGG